MWGSVWTHFPPRKTTFKGTTLAPEVHRVGCEASLLPEPLCELKGLVLDVAAADGRYELALRMKGAPAGVEHVHHFEGTGKLEMRPGRMPAACMIYSL